MTIPVPVLDDRSFEQLAAEAKARIPVHTPEWTNLNASDPGVTLVELFAFLAENLSYRTNRLLEANRLKFLSMLGVALQPPTPGSGLVTVTDERGGAVRQILAGGSTVLAGKVPFVTVGDMEALPVSSVAYYKQPINPDPDAAQRYQLIYQTFLERDTDVLTFYQPVSLPLPTPGLPEPVVDLGDPVGGTVDRTLWLALLAPPDTDLTDVRGQLGGRTLAIGVYPAPAVPGRVLPPMGAAAGPGLVVEIAAPEPDPSGLAGPGFGIGPPRYRRLPTARADDVLASPGIIEVELPPADALLVWAFDPEEEGTGDYPPRVDDADVGARLVTWLRLRLPPLPDDADAAAGVPAPATAGCGCCAAGAHAGAEPATVALTRSAAAAGAAGRITWAGVNAVPVVQAVPVAAERLGVGTGTPFQTFGFANGPVVTTGGDDAVVLTVQPAGGDPQRWHPIDDIYAAGADEPAFVLDPAAGTVTTGNGLQGGRVPLGAVVTARYSWGGGPQGQAAIGALNRCPHLPSAFTVSNPVPTWGAGPGETAADGEAAVSRWLRHRDRLVTAEDFRDVTRRTPGVDIGRVEVLPLVNPDQPASGPVWPGMVTVMVVPRSDPLHVGAPTPDRQFLDAVCAWLDPRRLVTTELHVRGPVYQPIWVSVGIEVIAGQLPAVVVARVRTAVEAFLSPLTGGLPPDPSAAGTGWPLGVDLRAQDVEAVATRVTGVRYVTGVRMAQTTAGGGVVGGIDRLALTGLMLPAPTVIVGTGPAEDPAALIGSSRPVPPTQVAVPVVPPTC